MRMQFIHILNMRRRTVYMGSEEYKKIIIEMFQHLDGKDSLFLKQVYTIVKRYLQRKGRR